MKLSKTNKNKIAVRIDGLTIRQFIAHETRRRKTTWWGTPCYIKPIIHPKIFGDGLQLCYLGIISQRPHYWVIRIDSNIDVAADDFNSETNLLEPMEDEFGCAPDFIIDNEEFKRLKKSKDWKERYRVDEWDTYGQYARSLKYPVVRWDGGHFGMIANFRTGEKGE